MCVCVSVQLYVCVISVYVCVSVLSMITWTGMCVNVCVYVC